MPPKRLEPWLRDKLDSGKIRGLRWVDRSQLIWEMPWKDNKETEVGDPDAVMLTEMARHLYKYKGDIPTNKEISEWKRKFRCSLTSLKGVKELKECHYLDGETKTLFKVYQFTSGDEQSAASVHPANMNTSNTIRNFHGNLKRAAPAEQDGMLFSGHTITKRQRQNSSPHNCGPYHTPAVVVGLSGSRISHQLTPSSSRDYFMDGPADTRGSAENQNTNITGQQVIMNATSNSDFFTQKCQNNVPQTSIVPCSYESAIMDDDDDLWGSDDDMTGMATNGTSETVPLTTIIESSVPAIPSKVTPGCQTSSSTLLCNSAAPKIISSEGALSSFTNHLQSTTSKMYFPEAQPACPIPPPITTSCASPPRTYSEGITPQCTAPSSNLSSLGLLLDKICSQDMISQFTTSNSEISPIIAPQGMRPQNTASPEEISPCDAPDDTTNLLSFSLELQYPFISLAGTEKKVDDTKLSCNNPEPSKDNAPQGTEFQNMTSYEETSLMNAPGGTTLLDIPLEPKKAELQYPSHRLAVTEKKVGDIIMKLSSNKPELSKDNAPQGIETQNTASYEETSRMEAPGGTTLLDISIVPKNAELQYPSDSLEGTKKNVDNIKLSLNEFKPSTFIDDATMAISIHYFGNRVMETPIKNKGIRLCHVPDDYWRDSIKTCKDPEQYGPCNFPLLEFPSVKSCLALTPEQQGVVKKVLERLKRGISFSLEGSDIYACRHSNAVAFYRPPENEHFQKMERQQKVKAFDLCKILTSAGFQESLKSSQSFVRFSFGTEDPNTSLQQAAVEVDVYNMAFYRAQSLSVEGGSQCADVLCSMSDGFDTLLEIEQELLDDCRKIVHAKTSSLGSLPTGASTPCMVR